MNVTPFAAGRALWPRSSRRAVACLVSSLCLTLTALALAPALASAGPPRGFVGLQSWTDPSGSRFDTLKDSKVSTFRAQLSWTSVEPNKPTGGSCHVGDGCVHEYRWGRYDRMFEMAGKRGIRILPVLLGSPRWAASKAQNPPMQASQRKAFYAFTEAAVDRYGPNGSFWPTKNLSGATVGANDWQVWNEVNLPNYWNGRPNAAEYSNMVVGTNAAIKRGDGSARTVLAGMPWSGSNATPPEFWKAMFKANPRIHKSFYAAAIHPYARTSDLAINEGIRPAVRALDSLVPGDYRRYMWITEMGWASGKADGRFQVSEYTQGRNLELFYRDLAKIRTSNRILGAVWFNLVDLPGADWWAERTGLIRSNKTYKPAWYRLKCVTGASGCRR